MMRTLQALEKMTASRMSDGARCDDCEGYGKAVLVSRTPRSYCGDEK
jgi:hypothetical protein